MYSWILKAHKHLVFDKNTLQNYQERNEIMVVTWHVTKNIPLRSRFNLCDQITTLKTLGGTRHNAIRRTIFWNLTGGIYRT